MGNNIESVNPKYVDNLFKHHDNSFQFLPIIQYPLIPNIHIYINAYFSSCTMVDVVSISKAHGTL